MDPTIPDAGESSDPRIEDMISSLDGNEARLFSCFESYTSFSTIAIFGFGLSILSANFFRIFAGATGFLYANTILVGP